MVHHGVWHGVDVLMMSRVRLFPKSFSAFYCRSRTFCFNCRQMSTVPRPYLLPSTMSAWQLHEYGSINQLKLSNSVPLPVICRPHDVLVRVHAASVNPIDVMMVGKYCVFCASQCICLWFVHTADTYKTRQFCLVRICGVNTIGDATKLSCLVCICDVNTTADKTVLSCPCLRCEQSISCKLKTGSR